MDSGGLFDDKRKLKRRHLIYYLRIFDNSSGELLGHLVDVTSEGLMMISENSIENGKDFELRMVLPLEILSREELLFHATSIWCKKDVNPDFFATGFQISDIPMEDIAVIERLIRKHGFQD
ncbi:MAG: PilZ domain-containing protein [Anaerolineaceae bacterium]|jgi:hypothetical protein|nr:PilZ domain-containing protein [Anaerolineaceae bacterium]